MEARNRRLEDWYGKVRRGEIKLPRFQRHEAWDWGKISSLINTITKNLPLGITLVLEVGNREPFVSRFLSTAPEGANRVIEHLLDGQQRLTAIWRVLNNNYEWRTYFIYIPEFDEHNLINGGVQTVFSRVRYPSMNGQKYPLWCDKPSEVLERGLIPTELLRPEDIQQDISDWINNACNHRKPEELQELEAFFEWKKSVSDKINELRSVVSNYNLPYLSLPSETEKDVALEVFINMNTNSKPLSTYDIIVAEIENELGRSLHEMQEELDTACPDAKMYESLQRLILTTSALIQDKLPNQKGFWDMDKAEMVNKWEELKKGLNRMANFLREEGIIDNARLPTNAVLPVIAALFILIPENNDALGRANSLLRKYLWSSFFTDRYENSAATNAYADFQGLKRVILGRSRDNGDPFSERDIPVLDRNDYSIADKDELKTAIWPKRDTIRGRAILAVACLLGSKDFASGERIDRNNINTGHYHHIYPDSLLKEADINSFLALNCALISGQTNQTIGGRDPLSYLTDRYQWAAEDVVRERLDSHLIPVEELSNGGYEGMEDNEKKDKIKLDFENFLEKRARLFAIAAQKLTEGIDIKLEIRSIFDLATRQ